MSVSSVQCGGRRGRPAFTLAELLVVIGIISVLIAVLLPALSRARSAAQSVACSSNLRQVGQGIATYAASFRDLTPATATIVGNVPWGNCYGSGWVTRLTIAKLLPSTPQKNRDKEDVFACPIDERSVTDSDSTMPYFSSYKGVSYMWTADLPGGPAGDTMFNNNTPLRMGELRVPAMEKMPWHNTGVYPVNQEPNHFPLITEEHTNEGMTQDPWGFPYSSMFQVVPHPQGRRATLMNDLSVSRLLLAWDHPSRIPPTSFYFSND